MYLQQSFTFKLINGSINSEITLKMFFPELDTCMQLLARMKLKKHPRIQMLKKKILLKRAIHVDETRNQESVISESSDQNDETVRSA